MTSFDDVCLIFAFLYLLKSTVSTLSAHTLFSALFTLTAAAYVSRWLFRRFYDDWEEENTCDKLATKITDLEGACRMREKEIEAEKEKRGQLEAENKKIPVLKQELENALSKNREGESCIESLKKKISDLEGECQTKDKEIEAEKDKTSNKFLYLCIHKCHIEAENKQIPALKQEIEDALRKSKEGEGIIETLRNTISDLEGECQIKDKEIEAEKEKSSQLEAENKQIPVLKQEIEDALRKSKEGEGIIETLRKTISDLEGECQIKDKEVEAEKEKSSQLEARNKEEATAFKEKLENALRENERNRLAGGRSADLKRIIVLERELEKKKHELEKEREKNRELVHIGNQHAEKRIRELEARQADNLRVAMDKCDSLKAQMILLTEEKKDMQTYYTNVIAAEKEKYERMLAVRAPAGQGLDEFGNHESLEISMQGDVQEDLQVKAPSRIVMQELNHVIGRKATEDEPNDAQ